MGTRCDLYVGLGKDAEWLGSYPFDGYPDGMPESLLAANSEAEYRREVQGYLSAGGGNSTRPGDGWPWPWGDSRLTDYAYAFDAGRVWASHFGSVWFDPLKPEPDDLPKSAVFPDMSELKSATLGPRSGLIV